MAKPPRHPMCLICGGPLDRPKRVADLDLLKICPACFAKQRDDRDDGPDP